jgi:hypothetical protein
MIGDSKVYGNTGKIDRVFLLATREEAKWWMRTIWVRHTRARNRGTAKGLERGKDT